MKILFITRFYSPHVGGVEKHVLEISKSLVDKNNQIIIVTEKYNNKLKNIESLEGIKIIRFQYTKIKYFGLIYIWWWLYINHELIKNADIIHIHDVFIWYLPFRFLYQSKKIVTTIHGLEWDKPLSKISLFQKRLAIKLSNRSFGVGNFLEKYLHVSFSNIIYGAAKYQHKTFKKEMYKIVYVGRLEENNGLLQFLKWLEKKKNRVVDFCGDGPLREECEKYGTVHGFTDPISYYKKASICVPGGYLAALEALSYGCELKLFWNNKIKEDYWKMSPFYKLKGDKLKKWASEQTWKKLANEYLNLYHSI